MSVEYSVILPTYNERDNLPITVQLLSDTFECNEYSFEIVVVDDGSPDGTGEVCRRLQKIFGEDTLKLVERAGKQGLGSAYVAGLAVARGTFVVIMDCDLSHHPKYIVDMIRKQKEADFDVVSGTRYAVGGGVHGWDLRRIIISRTANYLARVLLNPALSDLTGSFRLYRSKFLAQILPAVQSKGYSFQMEIAVRCSHADCTTAEVPIAFVDRIYGESKLGPGEMISYAKSLLTLFLSF